MKIGVFTEGGYEGKVPRDHSNMRTDLAWWCALEAIHHPLPKLHELPDNSYDFGIIIIPKKRQYLLEYPLIKELKRVCNKIGTMQESTFWYWQDDPIREQIWYYNTLMEMDIIFCHNDVDLNYYRGITGKKCELMPTLMIEDYIKVSDKKTESVMIGGNFVSIYRGFDSYMIANEISDDVSAPTTGRMKDEERGMDIKHLPWVTWLDWIYELSKHKYGVQLGTPSAGTFNLNCAYLGIPCIGYNTINTQKLCHPTLSVDEGDIGTARELAQKLKNNNNFYKKCSEESQLNFQKFYSEKVFKKTMTDLLYSIN